jgi:hypothetical protein
VAKEVGGGFIYLYIFSFMLTADAFGFSIAIIESCKFPIFFY